MGDSPVTNIIDLAMHRCDNGDNLTDAFHRMECALQQELSDCYSKLRAQDNQPSIPLLESIAQIQCAIDIIHSADSPEERLTQEVG